MRGTGQGAGRVFAAGLATLFVAALAGCGDVGGRGRADKATLAVDAYGCPNIDGTFQVSMPPEREGSQTGATEEAFGVQAGGRVPVAQIHAVAIRRTAPGVYDVRWLIDESRVRQQLDVIRQFEKPRYRRWYHLLSDPERARYLAIYGQASYDAELARLGPATEIPREWRSATGVTCRGGWIDLPRGELRPLRLTLGADGAVLGEFKGLKTVGVTVWCGDGCKDVPVPTGSFTGTIHWPRVDGVRAWRPQDTAGRGNLPRPLDEIQAEEAQRVAVQRRDDARRFESARTIRARIEAMAPAGTVVERVDVDRGVVRIAYSAPDPDIDVLLNRISEASGSTTAARPIDVVHRITVSGRTHVRSVEFQLVDSSLVLRNAPGQATVSDPPTPPQPPPQSAMATLVPAAQQGPPAGMATVATIRNRLGGLLPAGCTITEVRFGGQKATLLGTADSNRQVSDALRALDGVGARPELVLVRQEGGRVHFEIALAPSTLTRE